VLILQDIEKRNDIGMTWIEAIAVVAVVVAVMIVVVKC